MSVKSNSTAGLLIVALTAAPENTHNVRALIETPAVKALCDAHDVFFAADVKVLNLITGTMLNGCCPCPLCVWVKENSLDDVDYASRTLQRLRADYADLQQLMRSTGKGAKELAKYCCSQEAAPTFASDINVKKQIAPPALHLRMGIVTKLYWEAAERMDEEEWAAHEEAMRKCGVRRSEYHGQSFEGDQAKKLLRNLAKLKLCPNDACRPFYEALVAFIAVDKSCFGIMREDDYKVHISAFNTAYKKCVDAGGSATTKVHLVVKHVVEFLENFQCPKYGLGFFSEQALESSHSKFHKTWKNWNYEESTPGYDERVRQAVIDFNMLRFTAEYANLKEAGQWPAANN